MAQAAGRARALLAALFAGAVFKAACDGKGGPEVADEDVAAALAQVGPGVVLPAIDVAVARAEALDSAAAAWAADPADPTARANAQAAWDAMMEAQQSLELLQIGPAGSSLSAAGGADLRDRVYSWPTVNRCRVDQETVYEGWAEAAFFDTALVNVIGLDALEVLLFSPAAENACPGQVDINADGSWDALGAEGVQANRAAYAAVLAARVVEDTAALRAAWDPAGGDFGAALSDDSVYASQAEAFNAVYDALFYLETMTKDRKLGYALGVGACESTSCIGDIESPIAGESHRWIAVNLRAFRTLFTGSEGPGMDDVLAARGQEALRDAILAALDAADAANLAAPLDEAMAADPEAVQALFAAVKAVTDLFKNDVAAALGLQIPLEAAGDAD